MTTEALIAKLKEKPSRDNRRLLDEAAERLEKLSELPEKLVAMCDDYATFGDTQFVPGLYKAAEYIKNILTEADHDEE